MILYIGIQKQISIILKCNIMNMKKIILKEHEKTKTEECISLYQQEILAPDPIFIMNIRGTGHMQMGTNGHAKKWKNSTNKDGLFFPILLMAESNINSI